MNPLKRLAKKVRSYLLAPLLQNEQRSTDLRQLQLSLWYKKLAADNAPLPSLREVGFRAYSESDEDGILLCIFSVIGSRARKSIELCAGNGIDGNTANLIINHGWHGLLIDGNAALVRKGRRFYLFNPHTWIFPPVFVHSWVTRENINALIKDNGFSGEVDLLSLDMDGMDYWVWEALDVTMPRVVVLEYNDNLGPERSVTVPYQEDFYAYNHAVNRGMPNYGGASLRAYVKLAKKKGYRLVGCNRYCYNAFFIKEGLGEKAFPEIPVEACFFHPKYISEAPQRFSTVKDLPWTEV